MITTANVITLAVVGVCVLTAVAWYRVTRRRPTAQKRTAAAGRRVGLVPAAADNLPGQDKRALDECELILGETNDREAADAELRAGCARLWDAVLDEKNKEDQA